uniref:Type 2 DNA topoisomerase 6 subunit B-like n=1 Tax=Acanthochromis polyacanthus TaxID=80966 RepID=A0A3Q1GTZ1_9TELE
MSREIQQVLRLIMLTGKQKQRRVLKTAGGLLVLLWTETELSGQKINCTVLSDLKERMFPCVGPCPEPDPKELSAFTDLYGSLGLLLAFQMKDARHCTSEWRAHIEAFLRTFSLANAEINVHLKFRLSQLDSQQEFKVKIKSNVVQANQPSLKLDVTCSRKSPLCVNKGRWCQGGHPVLGGRLPLSIPPQAMDQGLLGELSVQFVTLLSPCVLQYPNAATELTHIQVLVYSPSNVPISGPSGFFQTLPADLDCQQLGLDRLHCSSFKDLMHGGGTVYAVDQENWDDPEQESVQQSLLVFLFLQHSDPFISHLIDIMATEVLIEHHLEDILNNNRQAVTTALQTELRNTLTAQNHRKKHQDKLHSAAEVIISSSLSIVSSSSNMEFRNTCLNRMKVHDTRELSASLRESLWRVTSWKFIPRGSCYSTQMDELPEGDELCRTEI